MKQISFIAIALLAGLLFVTACAPRPNNGTAQVQEISGEEVPALLQQPNTVLMDVRTPGEIAEGIIQGATVFADIRGADFEKAVKQLDKSKTYIVYCRSGARSSTAADYMVSMGFRNVYNLKGGIINWKGTIVQPE
ncbi:MAG TPA: rhodanese-like domain-containing protein [Lacibacter sp.]|nr:rhodanese-like domain-containing protein [Lacibacter sp.]HMO90317.1 rhodanese-like domain-containing protein [Lacibacter sp.]HMP88309.1 rhodanese-like domain-containing protein [Lacibacter sp.]